MTTKLPLTFACGPYDRMDALAEGDVRPAGINLNYISIDHPRDIFDRMIGGMEFDVSEMSSSEYICRYAGGERDLVAIPVFPLRSFRHNFIAVNTDIIKKPSDLNGKRIGVQLYTMTAAVWIRGILANAGVDLSTITWVEGAIEKPGSHGKPNTKPLLRPIKRISNDSPSKSLSQLLEEGEIAATIGAQLPPCFGKASNVQRLFPNVRDVQKEYYRETGIFPIMHVVVIKKELVDKYPFIPTSLFNAMNDSKDIAMRRLRFGGGSRYMLPFMQSDLQEVDELFGGDPWPYGLEANRKTLEALVSYLYDQAMIDRKVPLEELFLPTYGHNLKT
jgi:4,5-dihydroxyphthalate decarboxylase